MQFRGYFRHAGCRVEVEHPDTGPDDGGFLDE